MIESSNDNNANEGDDHEDDGVIENANDDKLKNNDDNVGDNDRSRQAVSTVRAVKLEFGKENRSCGGAHHLSQMITVRSLKRLEWSD